MRKTLVLAAAMLAVSVTSSFALKEVPLQVDRHDQEARAILDQGRSVAPGDTVCFGGNGSGDGVIVTGGVWDWEGTNNEAPQFFDDGDPVGNQFRDGWSFSDQTAKVGPSQNGAPHFNADGVYNFNYDATVGLAGLGAVRPGGWAHRADIHTNGANGDEGPNPLQGSWSVWIGTNLFLNPEHCAWAQRSGYGDGWSQGIYKAFPVAAGSDGAVYTVDFFHRYACEAGFDTAWVEVSTDGRFWNQVNALGNANGVYNGGDANGALPLPAGFQQNGVGLLTWQGNNAGTLYVRFRLTSDAFYSDQNESGNFRFAWQVDNIQLRRGGAPVGVASDFEAGYDNWKIASFEGYDFDLTLEAPRAAGRIVDFSTITCQPVVTCPDACALEGNILMFSDKDDCDLHDSFQDSYAVSPAFRIDPAPPLPPNSEGRIIETDLYTDGGAGLFNAGFAYCWTYFPFNASRCPFTPGAGAPGAGTTFNWSITAFPTCDFFALGTGTDCSENLLDDISANLPAEADSLTLFVGAFSQCRSSVNCDVNDNGTPFYDNLKFCVYNPSGGSLSSVTLERYADAFPTANTAPQYLTQTARSDGAHSFSSNLGSEIPLRWVRSDSTACTTGSPNTAIFLRWAVERGACQPNLGNAFFVAFPPSAPGTFPTGLNWHAARMDTGRTHGSGINAPGTYMSCFHENDPRNGTIWPPSAPPPVEPCDDILPDNLFTAGTNVYYFFEARNATTGAVTGTFPATGGNAPISSAPQHKALWLQWNVLPRLNSNCDGSQANGLLVVSDYQSNAVPGRGTQQRERLVAALESLGLDFDVYDTQGTNYTDQYGTIGRREDRQGQVPRPPHNGASTAQLEGYDCIWYQGGLLKSDVTLSDRLTSAIPFGGQPSIDQQKLEAWITGCTTGNNRLLVLEGIGWASDIDVNTTNGPNFLLNRGVDVLADDYAQDLAIDDLRRCARIVGQGPGAGLDAEVFGSGCEDNLDIDVIAAINGGVAVANFVYSGEDFSDPVNCADDQNRAPWHAIVRRETGAGACQKSVSMSFSFSELYPLNCADECLFGDFSVSGEAADLVIDLFQWSNTCPINSQPIGVEEPTGAPRFTNALYQAQPNPANPSATIRYTIAEKGQVSLRIFDVGGRLVRTLVDQVQEPAEAGFEVVWDGMNDQGQRVGSGVFFYQIDAPSFTSSKKLVILK